MDYNMADTGFMYPSKSYKKLIHSYLTPSDGDQKFAYDGIFASSDHLAYLICDELRKMGLSVPKDVQVIGFDGMPDFITGEPIVSSIRQPIDKIAKTGIEMLLKMIKGQEVSSVTDLPVTFVDGGTTL
jgi:LacI family transcriptional regulator